MHIRCLLYARQAHTLARNRRAMPRQLTHLLVLDFEATCVENGPRIEQEIIEFPCLLYNLETKQVDDVFHSYVRPVVVPTLSDFCTQLTGIQQVSYQQSLPVSFG
jgi:ERI1 exoribonuclease 3